MFYYSLYIKNSEGRGNGVFTKEFIPKNSLIEISPFLIIDNEIIVNGSKSKNNINDYLYRSDNQYHLVLGYGSLYNHNDVPNIFFKRSDNDKTYKYYSLSDIDKNHELFLKYGNKKHEWV